VAHDPTSDELAIQRLAAAYTDAVNRNAPAEAAATYAPHGALTMMERPPVEGRTAVAEFLAATFARYDLVAQTTHSGVVHVMGDVAHARWQVSEMQLPSTGGSVLIIGRYEDELIRLPQGWRFTRRRFTARYHGDSALTDPVLPDRPVLFQFPL
jgi:ketosteroid isomerase-like protein